MVNCRYFDRVNGRASLNDENQAANATGFAVLGFSLGLAVLLGRSVGLVEGVSAEGIADGSGEKCVSGDDVG